MYAFLLSFIVVGCTKTDNVKTDTDEYEELIEQLVSDPDIKPIAYMLNKDYIQLRMSVHNNDSNLVEKKAKEIIRAMDYIAVYGYKLQEKYKFTNTLTVLSAAAEAYFKKHEVSFKKGTKNTVIRSGISQCQSGLLFNAETKMCDWPENCPEGSGNEYFMTDEGLLLPVVTVTGDCYMKTDMVMGMLALFKPKGYKKVFGEPCDYECRKLKMTNEKKANDCYDNQYAYIDAIFDAEYDNDTEGAGGGGNGGGGGSGTAGGNSTGTVPSLAALKATIKNKPFALFDDLPCDLIRSWLSVAKYVPGQNIINKLNSIDFPAPVAEFYGIKPEDMTHIQNINDAYSLVVNMDYFPVHVSELPMQNGIRLTPGQFLNFFRLNINAFLGNKAIFTPYQAYGVNDVSLWNSSSPVGSILNIDFELSDNGSVITSYADPARWIFTTVHEPIYGDHPVSGNRVFGYIENGDGSYTFYTQGVDRLTTMDASLLQEISEYLGYGIPFGAADALWATFQMNISKYINDNEGHSTEVASQIHRPDWQVVKDVLEGKRPLSDLSKDC